MLTRDADRLGVDDGSSGGGGEGASCELRETTLTNGGTGQAAGGGAVAAAGGGAATKSISASGRALSPAGVAVLRRHVPLHRIHSAHSDVFSYLAT